MLARGTGAGQFQAGNLALWLMWRANEVGWDEAREDVENFLNEDEIEIDYVVYVYGPKIDNEIEILDGLALVPLECLTDCDEKEIFLKFDFGPIQSSRPSSALKLRSKIGKIYEPSEAQGKGPPVEISKLRYTANLINAVDGAFCFPAYETAYCAPHVPLGIFGGAGGGAPAYDTVPNLPCPFDAEGARVLSALLPSFQKMSSKNRAKLKSVLRRLGLAKAKRDPSDSALDLGIAVEMMLLGENGDQPLSHTLRARGAWLIGDTAQERHQCFNTLRDIYIARSQVAHSGRLKNNERLSDDCYNLASQIARELVFRNGPLSFDEWQMVTLGNVS